MRRQINAALSIFIRNFINIVAIGAGFTAFFLVGLYYLSEASYDSWIENIGSIYRLDNIVSNAGAEKMHVPSVPGVALPILRQEIPEITKAARIFPAWIDFIDANKNIRFSTHFVDAEFLDIFDVRLIFGSRKHFTEEYNSILLSKDLSIKLFGVVNAVGQKVKTQSGEFLTVSGIMENWPLKSHLQIESLASIKSSALPNSENLLHDWGTSGGGAYVEVSIGADVREMEKNINNVLKKHAPKQYAMSPDGTSGDPMYSFIMTHLEDAHKITQRMPYRVIPQKQIMLFTLAVICVALFSVSLVNFMILNNTINLDAIFSIGIQKSLGAENGVLFFYLLLNSIPLAILVSLTTFIELWLVFPLYVEYVNMELTITQALAIAFSVCMALPVSIALFGALYLAWLFIGKSSSELLNIGRSKSRTKLRYSLIMGLQFSLAVLLVSLTLLMNAQVNYIKHGPKGYSTDSLHVVWGNSDSQSADTLVRISSLIGEDIGEADVAVTGFVPGDNRDSSMSVRRNSGAKAFNLDIVNFGANGFGIFNIQALAGRLFDRHRDDDVLYGTFDPISVVLNEKALTLLGFESYSSAVGTYIDQLYGGDGQWRKAKIIGVVENFKYKSLFDKVPPTVFVSDATRVDRIVYKNPNNDEARNRKIKNIWKKIVPTEVYDEELLDDYLRDLYRQVQTQTTLVTLMALLCLVLSLVGIYATVATDMFNSAKDIAIRFVLGASWKNIFMLLIQKNLRPIIVSCFVMFPVYIYFATVWLDKFAYYITFSFSYFIMGVVVCGSAFLLSTTPFIYGLVKFTPNRFLHDE